MDKHRFVDKVILEVDFYHIFQEVDFSHVSQDDALASSSGFSGLLCFHKAFKCLLRWMNPSPTVKKKIFKWTLQMVVFDFVGSFSPQFTECWFLGRCCFV